MGRRNLHSGVGVLRLRLLAIAGAIALGVLLAGIGAATSARVTRMSAGDARFVSARCPTGLPANVKNPRCGYLVVPENRARPAGRKIRLAVVRIPAVSHDPSRVPVVYLNGGPGSDALGFSGELVDAGLNHHREVIVLAQRGTYGSKPLLPCRPLDNFRAKVGRRLSAPSTGRGLAAAAARCRARLRARGIDLAAFNTIENAADVADLRQVLKIRSWDVFAHSYGTELGLTYMRLHPAGIHSVVLDGTVPPSVASLGWTWSSFRESFDNIFNACRAQKPCRERYPHIAQTYVRLVNRLAAHPVTTSVWVPGLKRRVTVNLDGDALVNWLTRQSHFAATVPLEIDELAHGHPRRIALEWAEARATAPAHRGIFGYGLTYGVWCSEWLPYQTKRQELRLARRAFPGFPGSVLAQAPQLTWLREICHSWNVPKAPASIRDVTRSKIPTLAITGTFDAQTGAQWGSYAARTLKNSIVVELPGVAHGAIANPCGAKVINSFYNHLRHPDTSCVRSVHPKKFVIGPP